MGRQLVGDSPHPGVVSGPGGALSQRAIAAFWAPLAGMWLMMSLEGPMIAAVIARLPHPEINLAAFQLTWAMALLVESPVIMLLTAGTALPSTVGRYRRLLAFTTALAVCLTVLHFVIAVTPLYDWIVGRVIAAPPEAVEPSRRAFLLMLPWTGAIAFRRMWQGVMIRFDATRSVGATTVLRLAATATVCAIGLGAARVAGASVGAIALSTGVIVAALSAYALVRPILATAYRGAPRRPEHELTWERLLSFYSPLALTSLIVLGAGPVLSFGLGHAPDAITALAVWPVVMGLVFLVRSGGFALQEAVIALLERPGSFGGLRRFSFALAACLTVVMGAFALTPLGAWYMHAIAGLDHRLVGAALAAMVWLLPVPGLTVAMSWYRGQLVHVGDTPAVTRATTLNLTMVVVVMLAGLALMGGGAQGAVIAAAATSAALSAEVAALARAAGRRRSGRVAAAGSEAAFAAPMEGG